MGESKGEPGMFLLKVFNSKVSDGVGGNYIRGYTRKLSS